MGFRLALLLTPAIALLAAACGAQEPVPEPEGRVVDGPDGTPWVKLMTPEHDRRNREGTYKPYTHLFGFDGETLLTKGAGGRFTHHRGLYIGWNKTHTAKGDFDTWHMRDCYQAQVGEIAEERSDDQVVVRYDVHWKGLKGEPFISEVREHVLRAGEGGERIVDFTSTLTSLDGTIELRGDSHHAGMQVRLANEITEHEDTTEYILPEGAEEIDNDEVVDAHWTTCSAVIEGKRYWVLHMTDPDIDVDLYSIRRYARFGAFFQPDLAEGAPKTFRFRVVLSETPLDRDASAERYAAFVADLGGE